MVLVNLLRWYYVIVVDQHIEYNQTLKPQSMTRTHGAGQLIEMNLGPKYACHGASIYHLVLPSTE